jgi:hypothetical protein
MSPLKSLTTALAALLLATPLVAQDTRSTDAGSARTSVAAAAPSLAPTTAPTSSATPPTIIMVGGGALGLYGLWLYLR